MDYFPLFNHNPVFRWLAISTLALLGLTLILIAAIFTFQLIKKNRFMRERDIEAELDEWLVEVLLDEDAQVAPLSDRLNKYFQNPRNHTFITGKLITIRKNISGSCLEKVTAIYKSKGLKEGSLKKFRSLLWRKKSAGIYELYMMGQQDLQAEISKHTNSSNDFERMEAQIAAITFEGFAGLSFMDTLTNPITEWQQIKLMEQLNGLPAQTIEGLENWLSSDNNYVLRFALKLTSNYQQLHVHPEVAKCLDHPDEKIRTEAISTLASIANSTTAAILTAHYPREQDHNKRNILSALLTMAGDEEQDFLLGELDHPGDDFKVLAASVLLSNTSNGEELLARKAQQQPNPYKQILLHVKRDLAL